ncbi:DNA ligase D [Radiobacillus sp. PE A8.2]|uniref:DNA ligase D n=1 Tax=Radiobacillus sp. PE A8.2 TaxID=3380349 RepID=UPI00388DC344
MDIMKPIASVKIPSDDSWIYEVKYDGFRAILSWDQNSISLVSRNGKDLSNNFPEIIDYCLEKQALMEDLLPLQLDGEVVILNTLLQSNFPLLQQRGRFKANEKIKQAASVRPAHFLVFDLLLQAGKSVQTQPLHLRKQKLYDVFASLGVTTISWHDRLGLVSYSDNQESLWEQLITYKGEGVVAKRLKSRYVDGKAHSDWFKIKNWRTIHAFITSFDQNNGYFDVSVYQQATAVLIGKFKHGLEGEELDTLKNLIDTQGQKRGNVIELPPGICVAINCLDAGDGELREPEFNQFRLDLHPEDCTIDQLQWDLAMFPKQNDISKRNKIFYDETNRSKGDLLVYLRNITPFMLPFLKNKALTIIRCPDGIHGESFFQKHLPDYAPDYVAGIESGKETLLRCDHVEALIWFGNHGALEYHVPFQHMGKDYPVEIAFDLDPPNIEAFELAIFAAQLLKQLLDKLQLISYVKTSGNKGLQIYVPIPDKSLSYEDTAALTNGLAQLLVEQYPDHFTTERMKKNRGNRLYIDYVQHGKDKTLIAPYSPRINPNATVSTPLFWDEVQQGLTASQFTIANVVDRVLEKGCPFADYYHRKDSQDLHLIKDFIANIKTK